MALYYLLTFIVCICALFSYINFKWLKLPATIGTMLLSLIASVIMTMGHGYFPFIRTNVESMITLLPFQQLLLKVMLGFLLFAGAIHVNTKLLLQHIKVISLLAVLGVVIAAGISTLLFWGLFTLLHLPVSLGQCALLAAIISPTDPVAVIALLKKSPLSQELEIVITAEALFNDGIAVVLYTCLAGAVAGGGASTLSAATVSLSFLQIGIGGIAFGFALGFVGQLIIKSIDRYEVEILITIALVMGGYNLAEHFHVSGALAIVVMGLMIGNTISLGKYVSAVTKDYLHKVWEIIEFVLNAILFLYVGFQLFALKADYNVLLWCIPGVGIALASRWVSVWLPSVIFFRKLNMTLKTINLLTWGGLRGGLSLAMVLALPASPVQPYLLTTVYGIVVFSMLVQGTTLAKIGDKKKK
ncbi:MAG: sodium:proton antiporter [Chitinophagia bacterium]|nr:sodium:proton antiporter [Chitinophagia bacterium]